VAHFVLSEKTISNLALMAAKDDAGHFGLEQLLRSADGQRLRNLHLRCNLNGTTLHWLVGLLTQSMEAVSLGYGQRKSELGRFLNSAKIQHLYALYIKLHPMGTTSSWLSLLVYQSWEFVLMEASWQNHITPTMEDIDDHKDDGIIMPLPPARTSYDHHENHSNNGINSINAGSSHLYNLAYVEQHVVGPYGEDGVLASLPLRLTSSVVGNRESEASSGSTTSLEAIIEDAFDSKDSKKYVSSSDSTDNK
jgi:hypothetical protein